MIKEKEHIDRPSISYASLYEKWKDDSLFFSDNVSQAHKASFYGGPWEIYVSHNRKHDVVSKKITDYTFATKNNWRWFLWKTEKAKMKIH